MVRYGFFTCSGNSWSQASTQGSSRLLDYTDYALQISARAQLCAGLWNSGSQTCLMTTTVRTPATLAQPVLTPCALLLILPNAGPHRLALLDGSLDVLKLLIDILHTTYAHQHAAPLLQLAPLDERVGRVRQEDAPQREHNCRHPCTKGQVSLDTRAIAAVSDRCSAPHRGRASPA